MIDEPYNYISAVVRSKRRHPMFWISLVAVLVLGVTELVYLTGGTGYAWLHLMYIPIILAATIYRVWGGLIIAVCAGLLLGPFMPLDTVSGTAQSVANWSFRIMVFGIIGITSGIVSLLFQRQLTAMEKSTLYDRGTGLPNFVNAYSRLNNVFEQEGTSVAQPMIGMIDITNHREIINTLGYRSVSELILQVTDRLRGCENDDLWIARLHESCFVVISNTLDIDVFIQQCKHICDEFDDPLYFETIPVSLNVCVGIATGATAESTDDLIQQASIAVNHAVEQRLSLVIYSNTIDSFKVESFFLLGSLKKALERSELELFYQPKIAIADNSIKGVEALIRWQHAHEGIISPDRFIPQAENTWLVHPLSIFVVKEALRQIKTWHDEGRDLKLAVNLTANNIESESFIEEMVGLLDRYEGYKQYLEIEITERYVLTDMKTARSVLDTLSGMGICVSIDDFGTGYSRVHYLDEFTIDEIKIDQRFIRTLADSSIHRSFVSHIIQIAKEVNVTVVAEGVETKEIYNILKDMGCDIAQGYYISRPLPVNTFDSWCDNTEWKMIKN